jgi:hypothetical protein
MLDFPLALEPYGLAPNTVCCDTGVSILAENASDQLGGKDTKGHQRWRMPSKMTLINLPLDEAAVVRIQTLWRTAFLSCVLLTRQARITTLPLAGLRKTT